MPEHRSPGVPQTALAAARIVVPQEKIVVEAREAEPTENVFASLAHHLRASGVSLDRHATHRTWLDFPAETFEVEAGS